MGVEEQQATYPEHEKLMAVKDESQTIGEFLEGCGYTLCEVDAESYTSPRWTPTRLSIQQVLADYFGIDLRKIEAEKRAMLAAFRSKA